MAQVIKFFELRVRMGDEAAAGEYYSEVFDIAGFPQIVAELRVSTASAAGTVSGWLQHTSDPTLAGSWQALGSVLTANGPGVVAKGTFSTPQRYVRAKVSVPQGALFAIAFDATVRESA